MDVILRKNQTDFKSWQKPIQNSTPIALGGGNYVDGIWQPNNKGLGMGKVLDFIGANYEVKDDKNIEDKE